MKFRKIIITQEKLNKILKSHEAWLNDDANGVRADLRNTDLGGFDLRGVNLSKAYLGGANLSDANLMYAALNNADLRYANLCNTNLSNAILNKAYLSYTNLIDADLSYANLNNANLYGANLYNATLRGADLTDSDLECVNLSGVDLTGAKGGLMEYRKGKVLTEPLIGYKKCKENVIVMLEIPKGAIVFSVNGGKCRTNKVKVIAIDGADVAISWYKYMLYRVGDEITIDNFNCEYNAECSTGIHFFMTREEAEAYCL